MAVLHPALAAAINALHDDVDIDDIRAALHDAFWALIIAVAARNRCIQSLASLAGGSPSLLSQEDIACADLHDSLRRFIGQPEGGAILQTWAHIAPVAWGKQHAHALRAAVRTGACPKHVATTLIGPCDDSVDWVADPSDIAVPIRRWGQTRPDDPTWWVLRLSPPNRRYVFDVLRRSHVHRAMCLPWLPDDMVDIDDLPVAAIPFALQAFADASATVHAMHAERMRRLMARADDRHLDLLARLVAAAPSATAWRTIQTLLSDDFDRVQRIVIHVPWRAIPRSIRAAILKRTGHSAICAAIAAARGYPVHVAPTETTAVAFFAAVRPAVWNRLDSHGQRQWREALSPWHASLAVRSLGVRSDILAHARNLSDDLIVAARLHVPETNDLRRILLPVALRALSLADAYALLAAMPQMPSNPAVFVHLASGVRASASRRTISAALRTPGDLATVVVAQRAIQDDVGIEERCAALTAAFHGRTWDEARPLAGALNDAARAIVMGDSEALRALAPGASTGVALRRALERMAPLPPAIAIPARCAFVALQHATNAHQRIAAVRALAHILHRHGESMGALLHALRDEDRWACLQIPALAAHDQAHACARLVMRALARDPMIVPALLLLTHDDPAQYEHGIRMLCASPHVVRNLLPLLRADMRERLLANAAAAIVTADLSLDAPSMPAGPRRRRTFRS